MAPLGALKRLKWGLVLLCHEAVGFCGLLEALATAGPIPEGILPQMLQDAAAP